MPSNQQIGRQAINWQVHPHQHRGWKIAANRILQGHFGQSRKLSIAVINWEAARAEGGSGAQQSAIG